MYKTSYTSLSENMLQFMQKWKEKVSLVSLGYQIKMLQIT